MSKWFESNFASYAKTALLEAQKRIDSVLDIKEEEIINDTLKKTNQQTPEITSSPSSPSPQPQPQPPLTAWKSATPKGAAMMIV